MDDTSVAIRLQQEYQDAGMDPLNALNTDGLYEFGGPSAFTGFKE